MNCKLLTVSICFSLEKELNIELLKNSAEWPTIAQPLIMERKSSMPSSMQEDWNVKVIKVAKRASASAFEAHGRPRIALMELIDDMRCASAWRE